jgi:hypothetical protein
MTRPAGAWVGTSVRAFVGRNSVEFFDMTGNTVPVVTPPATALRLPTPADRRAVRAVTA